MSDDPGRHEVPTYHANVVTSNLTVDELMLELRKVFIPHTELIKMKPAGQGLIAVPPPTPEQIMQSELVAKIVLTYSAAKQLKTYLDNALPKIEQRRLSNEVQA